MEHLQQLLKKYWAGELLDSEREELLKLLTQTPHSFPVESPEQPLLSDTRSRAVLESLHEKIADLQPAPVIRRKFPWPLAAAAASIILIVLITLMIPQKNTQQPTAITPQTPLAVDNIKSFSNKTTIVQHLKLDDGSELTLYPSSTIMQSFTDKGRSLVLEGQALFSVTHDIRRPFTVRSGALLTTVLGTRFLVNTHAITHHTQIRLLEGKIMVRSDAGNQIELHPGQEWLVDNKTQQTRLNNWAATEARHAPAPKKITPENLEFTRMDLADVFRRVGQRYNVTIRCTDRSIDRMTFTGKFLPDDSLETILNVICNTNDLLFQQENNIVTIKKMN